LHHVLVEWHVVVVVVVVLVVVVVVVVVIAVVVADGMEDDFALADDHYH
jgi:hypothetical protein